MCLDFYDLFKVVYDDTNERDLIRSYQFYSLLHLFRFISYSYPSTPRLSEYAKIFLHVIAQGDFKRLSAFIKRKMAGKGKSLAPAATSPSIAQLLLNHTEGAQVVVDYGCGLGYTSFEVGTLDKRTKVYLVDVDCITLEFAQFRFKKHGIETEVIPVTENNSYPALPQHTICIATEVMEHLAQPLRAYQNIFDKLQKGGILYGDFVDHANHMFHVSPDLSALRKNVSEDFLRVADMFYKKK